MSFEEGRSEYELLKELEQDEALSLLFGRRTADSLSLYRRHFILFHALYLLADQLAESGQALLDISPLSIQMHPYQVGRQQLKQTDSVREYYLHLDHYYKTGAQDVDELLASFWVGMHKLDNRQEALAELGLTDPVDDKLIRSTYQQLAMQHHPDRGGG